MAGGIGDAPGGMPRVEGRVARAAGGHGAEGLARSILPSPTTGSFVGSISTRSLVDLGKPNAPAEGAVEVSVDVLLRSGQQGWMGPTGLPDPLGLRPHSTFHA